MKKILLYSALLGAGGSIIESFQMPLLSSFGEEPNAYIAAILFLIFRPLTEIGICITAGVALRSKKMILWGVCLGFSAWAVTYFIRLAVTSNMDSNFEENFIKMALSYTVPVAFACALIAKESRKFKLRAPASYLAVCLGGLIASAFGAIGFFAGSMIFFLLLRIFFTSPTSSFVFSWSILLLTGALTSFCIWLPIEYIFTNYLKPDNK